MKRTNLAYFLLVMTLLALSAEEVRATPPEASEKMGREIIESLKEADSIREGIKKVGVPAEVCPGCAPVAPNLSVVLEGNKVDLGNPYYLKENEPYIIYLKRTSKTPAKIDLKFKNGHDYCAKMHVGTHPWSPNGPLIMGCLIYLTQYEEEEVSLNLKKLKPLKDGEEEVIEVRLSKRNPRIAKYDIAVKNISNSEAREEIGKKFLGGGYNVSFEAP